MGRTAITVATVALCWLLTATSAEAQRYRSPYGPTITPYLDYFRSDVGVLDQYNTFVNPHTALRDTINRQNLGIQGLQRQVEKVGKEAFRVDEKLEGVLNIRASRARSTGTGSTFMNRSHYYSR